MTRVLFIPDFGESNEYQNLLRDAVESDEFETVGGTLHALFPLVRNVRRERIDVVHLIWTHPFFVTLDLSSFRAVNALATYVRAVLFLLDLLLVRLAGADIVWTIHNKHNHERRHVHLDHAVSRVTARLASRMTVECAAAKAVIADLFWVRDPDRIHVIEEGSYIDSYPNTVSTAAAREHLGVDDGTRLFVYFGQIREYKGVDRLIDAFDEATLPDAKLLVVGNPFDDRIEAELRAAIEDAEAIEPVFEFVPNEEIQYYMNAADVVALPYRDILTSGSVLLAMSFGRPVVTPAIGCIPALVGDGGNFTYDPDRSGGLRESLAAANAADDAELERIGARNYATAEELSWGRVGDKTRRVYRTAQTA